MEIVEKVIQSKLFEGITKSEMLHLFNIVNYQTKNYDKDQFIAGMGEEVVALMVIIEGSVRGQMVDENGKTVKIENMMPPSPIAHAFLFGANNVFPVNVIANEPSKLLFIYKDDFIKLLQLNKRLILNFLNLVSDRAQFLSDKIKFLSFNTIKKKIASYILELSKGGVLQWIEMKNNQQELAEIFGITRPALARVFKELKDEGIIRTDKHHLYIINIDALKKTVKN